MTEEQYQILWNKAMHSYKAVGRSNMRRNKRSIGNTDKIMLQYQRTDQWSASGTPINFNKKIHNFGMEQNYNNGVVTITNPGIYLIQSSLRNYGSNNMRHDIIKNHQEVIIGIYTRPWMTGELSHVMNLDFLDTVNIRLTTHGPHKPYDINSGYFTVLKLN